MSATGPSSLLVVGRSDSWDLSRRSTRIAVGRTLRDIRGEFLGAGQHGTILSRVLRAPARGMAYYAEFELLGSTVGWFRGGVIDRAPTDYTLDPQLQAGAVTYNDIGQIAVSGAVTSSGNPSLTIGDRLGVRFRNDAGTLRVQFFKNGATAGPEQTWTPTNGGGWLLSGAGGGVTTTGIMLHTDAADLRHLPSGSQPWGAAIRAADAGGYTPELAGFTNGAIGPDTVIVSGGRAVTQSHPFRTAYAGSSTRSGMRYFEVEIEVGSAGEGNFMGFVRATANLLTVVGGDVNGWAYDTAGNRVHNGVSTGGYPGYDIGDRVGAVIDAAGRLWFLKNGTVLGGGNPEAGSAPAFTGVTGDIRPAVSPRTNGRMRIFTSASELKHLPDYAMAWDGGALPEQHFEGRLLPGTEIVQSVRFPQWGGQSVMDGSPVGRVALVNADGKLDTAGTKWLLRDERLSLFAIDDSAGIAGGVADWEASAIVDSVILGGEDELTIVAQSALARLDKRVSNKPALLLGTVRLAPLRLVGNSTLTYQLDTDSVIASYNAGLQPDHLDVRGGGIPLTSWVYANTDIAYGIRRTVNPASNERHAVANAVAIQDAGPNLLSNSAFANWTAGVPDNWTVVVNGAGAITQSFTPPGARIQRPGAGDTASLQQGPIITGTRTWVLARVTVSSYTSGDLQLICTFPIASTRDFGINGTGTFIALFIGDVDDASWLISAKEGTDMVVSSITLTVQQAKTPSIRTPFELAGFVTTDMATRIEPSGANPSTVAIGGYYSENSPTCRELAELFTRTSMAAPYLDERGVVRWAQGSGLPGDYTTSAPGYRGALLESDVIGKVSYADDAAPALSTRAAASINYARHQESEVFGSATVPQRELVTLPHDIVEYQFFGNGLHPFYSHAAEAEPVPILRGAFSFGWAAAGPYKARLGFYRLTVSRNRARGLRVGHLVDFTYPRFDLNAKRLMIVSIARVLGSPEVQLTLWG